MSGKELPKIVDKTQADIDATVAAIESCNLPSGTKDFTISCVRLAVWLPKTLLEQKIRLSNLRKLIFGLGKRNHKKQNIETSIYTEQSSTKQVDSDPPSAPSAPLESEETPIPNNRASLPGHGDCAVVR